MAGETRNFQKDDRVIYGKSPSHIGTVSGASDATMRGYTEVLWDHAGTAGVSSAAVLVRTAKLIAAKADGERVS